ncbi:MAG: hypothetical protein ABJG47_19325 [Ekhidna sp.]
MKIYLWYDEVKKKYVIGRYEELRFPIEEALYACDPEDFSATKKIAWNLNKIR